MDSVEEYNDDKYYHAEVVSAFMYHLFDTGKITPLRNAIEDNQDDHFPRSFRESNQLFAKYYRQGFFAIMGKRHADTHERFFGPLTNPFVNILFFTFGEFLHGEDIQQHDDSRDDEKDPPFAIDYNSFLGLPDLANPLYWLTFLLITLWIASINSAEDETNNWAERLLSGTGHALLTPITLVVAATAMITSYIYDLTKFVIGTIGLTITSGFWYAGKLIQLHANDKQASDDYVAAESMRRN